MAAIARVLARNFSTTAPETETLKYIAMLCGAGLLVSLVLMSYGLDLSPGFFLRTRAVRRTAVGFARSDIASAALRHLRRSQLKPPNWGRFIWAPW